MELVQRLLEYEKFKKASEVLNERPLLRRDLWARGRRDIYFKKQEGELIVDESGLTGLLKSYLHAVRRVKKKVYQVFTDLQTIGERILELSPSLKVGRRQSFHDFIFAKEKEPRKAQILVTFLSFLELGKLGFVNLFQGDVFSNIYIETKRPIDESALGGIDSYESSPSESNTDGLSKEAKV